MKNHWVKTNDKLRIRELMDSYDFEKVKDIMEFMYPKIQTDINELKNFVSYLFDDLNCRYDGKPLMIGQRGFWVSKNEAGTYSLMFSIETWRQEKGKDFAECFTSP